MTATADFSFQAIPCDPEYRASLLISNGTFKIRVFQLPEREFMPDSEELHFYGDNNGELVAFETIQWMGGQLEEITAAMTWYAEQVGNPGMEITVDPATLGITVI